MRNAWPSGSRRGVVFESEFYHADLEVVKVATRIITEWNKETFITPLIRLNQPAIWVGQPGCSIEGQRMLVEPLIQNYTKFNSNVSQQSRVREVLIIYALHVML